MHILISRHNSSRTEAAGTPTVIPAAPAMIPAEGRVTPPEDEPVGQPAARSDTTAGAEDRTAPQPAGITGQDDAQAPADGEGPGQRPNGTSGERAQTGRGGRKAEASIGQLADIISRAYPDSGQATRAMAREAIEREESPQATSA